MIDFSKAAEELNSYKGTEKKKTLIYNNKKYLVKFPDPIREKNKNISYINNAFSEYIGSNIFKIVGFETQNTLLGTYTYNERQKIVCACEDFTDANHLLYEFENLALSINTDKKIQTELSDIMGVIDEIENLTQIHLKIIDNIKEKFWDMFIIDSLIGNTDRHNGNWGFLINESLKKIGIAPIYDCASCLYPQLTDEGIEQIINDKSEMEARVFVFPTSALKIKDKKIKMHRYVNKYKNV